MLNRLPWLSAEGRAVINLVACENGRTRSADLCAARLGLRTRFQLARLLRREGMPPYEVLTGWTSVLYWMLEADRTGITLLALFAGARRRARSRAILERWEAEERPPAPRDDDEVVH